MTNYLLLEWDRDALPDEAEQCGKALEDQLNELEHEFVKIGYDTKMPEYRQRWWRSAPQYSTVSKSFSSEKPKWKIGWMSDGRLVVMFTPPEYKQYTVRNMSAFEHMFGHEQQGWYGEDSERRERSLTVLQEGLYRLGMHPGGPNPPTRWSWEYGY